MAHLYICIEPGPFEAGGTLTLSGDEAHHAAAVGRLGVGEKTLVADGRGHQATALTTEVSPGRVVLAVESASFHPSPQPEVWLAQALAKGGRDEAAIQMACELGVDGIIPLQAQRSVSLWREDKVRKGVQRWQKIMLEASKQSLRAWVPTVLDPVDVAALVALATTYEIVVLDPDATQPLSQYQPEGAKPVLLVVGPEGGLAPEEINQLVAAGARALKLGTTVLRTSTAGPAALSVLNGALGRW